MAGTWLGEIKSLIAKPILILQFENLYNDAIVLESLINFIFQEITNQPCYN